MNFMFWKKKTPGGTEAVEADDDRTVAIARTNEAEETLEQAAIRPGLLARLANALSALRKPRDSSTEADDDNSETPEPAAAGHQDDETPSIAPARNMKKRLVIGGAIGLLIVLLGGIGFAITKILSPQAEQKPATADASLASHPAPHAETSQAEIEALKKKNAELQAQIEAIQKQPPQPPTPASESLAAKGNAASAASDGSDEITISNKDPKAAAQVLKAAIEEMNAASGGSKPHKREP